MDKAAASGAAHAGSIPAGRVLEQKDDRHAQTNDHDFSYWGQQHRG